MAVIRRDGDPVPMSFKFPSGKAVEVPGMFSWACGDCEVAQGFETSEAAHAALNEHALEFHPERVMIWEETPDGINLLENSLLKK